MPVEWCVRCQKVFRPKGSTRTEFPGTVARSFRDMCSSCYRGNNKAPRPQLPPPPPRDLTPQEARVVEMVKARCRGDEVDRLISMLGLVPVEQYRPMGDLETFHTITGRVSA